MNSVDESTDPMETDFVEMNSACTIKVNADLETHRELQSDSKWQCTLGHKNCEKTADAAWK